MSLNNLAISLWTQFEQFGGSKILEEAISLHQQALMQRPAPHPHQAVFLNNLANFLWTHFEQFGRREDLEETISLHQQALKLQPASHPD